jgi:hypothetical protein
MRGLKLQFGSATSAVALWRSTFTSRIFPPYLNVLFLLSPSVDRSLREPSQGDSQWKKFTQAT